MALQGFSLEDQAAEHRLHPMLTIVTGLDAFQREVFVEELADAAVARTHHPSSPVAVDPAACILRAAHATDRPAARHGAATTDSATGEARLLAEHGSWARVAMGEDEVRHVEGIEHDSADAVIDRCRIAQEAVDRLERVAQRTVLAAEDGLGLEALHAELEAAIGFIERRPRAGSQARIARLRGQEQALLERMGFSSWIEYRMATRGPSNIDEHIVGQLRRARAELDEATAARDRRRTIEMVQAEAQEQAAIAAAHLVLNRPERPNTPESFDAFELRVLQQTSALRRAGLPIIADDPVSGCDATAFDQAMQLLHDVASQVQIVLLTDDPHVVTWASERSDSSTATVIDLRETWGELDALDLSDQLVVRLGRPEPRPAIDHGAGHRVDREVERDRGSRPRPDGWHEIVLGPDTGPSTSRCPTCATVTAVAPCSKCGRVTCRACSIVPFRSRGRVCVSCALVVAGVRHRRPARR
jgi:hypothetical protein